MSNSMFSDTTYTNVCSTLQNAVKSKNAAFHKRLKELYPCVDDVTKLPHAWDPQARSKSLGLTNDNLGCYFRYRKTADDEKSVASAVRADRFIPPSCLLYYFEVKFMSKGRDGHMGVGLTSAVSSLDKLPGWEQNSYAYHADDGNIFDGNTRGTRYGPKSTTGDVVGCGYNLVEGKIFFTQNGTNLGKALDDIPSNFLFYPTIGLKTQGEEILVNFGQEKFLYDIEQDLRSLRKNMTLSISSYPISNFASWQQTLHKLVQSWLMQSSYPETAEAFSKEAKLACRDNMQRVKQRYQIQQFVMNGKISEAIKMTNIICPNLLKNSPNLLFALKCRQFIELISGAESDFQPHIRDSSEGEINNMFDGTRDNSAGNTNGTNLKIATNGDQVVMQQQRPSEPDELKNNSISTNNGCNGMIDNDNCEEVDDQYTTSSSYQELMEVDQPVTTTDTNTGNINHRVLSSNSRQTKRLDRLSKSNGVIHQNSEVRVPLPDREMDNDEQKFAKLISFGQELCDYAHYLDKTFGKDETNEKLLKDAIGLIAYINPSSESNIGKQLDPSEREPISQMLNSTILNTETGDAARPPFEDVMSHLKSLVRLNGSHGRWLVDELY